MRRLRPLALALLVACSPEKPPAPRADAPAAPAAADGPVHLDPAQDAAVFTYAGERGQFADASSVEAIPEEARGLVRVALLDGPSAPPGMVWTADLNAPDGEGRFVLSTTARASFEEEALGLGRSSAVNLPEGLEPPPARPPGEDIVVYKTDWCGVCKKLMAYLDRKGVKYVARDVEKDRSAAAELQAKAQAKGIKTGSVPVIDVRGELMVGFNRARLEQLL